MQLFSMGVMIALVGCTGVCYQRGAVASAGSSSFVVTAAVGGYTSDHLCQKLGDKWAWNIFVTALMFVGPGFLIWVLDPRA